jgi:hypothetical protein
MLGSEKEGRLDTSDAAEYAPTSSRYGSGGQNCATVILLQCMTPMPDESGTRAGSLNPLIQTSTSASPTVDPLLE